MFLLTLENLNGQKFVEDIKKLTSKSQHSFSLGGIGGFSGYIEAPSEYVNPVYALACDGVGTKMRLALQTNDLTIEFSWENTSPSPDFNSLSHSYNISTTNSQTGEVNITSAVWDFGVDYDSAVSTTQGGQINNWTRR